MPSLDGNTTHKKRSTAIKKNVGEKKKNSKYSFQWLSLVFNEGKSYFEYSDEIKHSNDVKMNTRMNTERIPDIHNNTESFKDSTVPYIQRMLNRKSPFLV